MDLTEKKKAIKASFQRFDILLSENILEKLANIADEVSFPKDDTILNVDQSQHYVFLILSGLARSYSIDSDGNDITKLFAQKNDYLIGESIFTETSLEAFDTITALKCLRFDAQKLRKIIFDNPDLTKVYALSLENTLRYKINREYQFQSLNATERYQNFRIKYADIEKLIPQNMIASYLGITKESLSRLRKKLFAN